MQQNLNYFGQAWKDLTFERGWWKPVLILGLVTLIPVIGGIIAAGYIYEWARDGAWGIRRSLTRQMGDVGKRLKFGFICFVCSLVWGLASGIVSGILGFIPLLGGLLSLAVSLLVSVAIELMCIRAVAYDEFAPAFQVSRVWAMMKAEPKSLFSTWLRYFVVSLAISIVFGILFALCIMPALGSMIMGANGLSGIDPNNIAQVYAWFFSMIMASGAAVIVPLLVLFAVLIVVVQALTIVFARALGLWMGQFNLAEWGDSSAPAPFEARYEARRRQQQWQQQGCQQGAPNAGQPVSYDPQTGAPIYQQQPAAPEPPAAQAQVSEEPVAQSAEQAQPAGQGQPVDMVIVGYDPQTGAPIYGDPTEAGRSSQDDAQ